jgi:hypothetical protein
MANFQTHLSIGTVAGSIVSSTILSLQLVSPSDVMVLWLLAILGSMLPDIDADNSTSSRLIFNFIGFFTALCFASWFSPVFSLIGLWLSMGAIYGVIRYILMPLFASITVHRGSMHSLLSCVMFALVAVHLSVLFGKGTVFSWLAGFCVIGGMIVHLTLDELYSVNLANLEFKRSFGTALKPLSLNYPFTTATHVFICVSLIYLAPSLDPLLTALRESDILFLPWQDVDNFRSWIARW